jgi:protein SSD1
MSDFNDAVKACLPEMPWTLTDVEVAQRRDLRSQRVFTIDTRNANGKLGGMLSYLVQLAMTNMRQNTVLDDAISIQKLGDETFEVGVHVADISTFIEPHSPLDKEARARASSVDLIHTTVPLLPSELTEQITNLNKGKDRYEYHHGVQVK